MELETVQLLKDSTLVATIIISMVLIVWLAFVLTKNDKMKVQIKKLKTWRKFSEIEKRQKRKEYDELMTQLYHEQHAQFEFKQKNDQLTNELAEERAFNDTQGSMHVRLMLKYAHVQEESEKLKKEHTKLKAENKTLNIEIREIDRKNTHLMAENYELRSRLSRKNLKRDSKGRVLPKSEFERDWTQASKEELLAEAKRRYPVGTKVIPFNLSYMIGNPSETVIMKPSKEIDVKDYEFASFKGLPSIWVYSGSWNSVVYSDGKWAQIITE